MRSLILMIQKTYQLAERDGSRQVMDNVAFLSGLQAITFFLPIFVIPYLFQVIGPEKFGLISFAQAFVIYFMILTDYAFNISATKKISLFQGDNTTASEIFSAVMTAKIILVLLSLFIFAAILRFVPKFSTDQTLYTLSFGAVIGNALFPLWLFQGMEKMKYIARLKMFGEFAYAFGIFLWVRGPADYLAVPIVTSSVSLFTGIMGIGIVFWRLKLSLKFPRLKHVRREIRAGKDLFLSIVAINAYTTTRVFAVGLLTNNTLTGFYSIAEKIASMAQTFPLASFSQAIFPRLSNIFRKNRAKAFLLMQQVQSITVRISLISLPLILILTSFIIRIVCGGDYPQATMTLRLLLISVFFVSANAFRVQFLLVCGKPRSYSRIHIIMASIGLPLLLLLIHLFSYLGAAMATVITEAGIFTLTYITVKRLQKNYSP
ncbi:MAG: flippase [Candidatus Omnitrophica bacterium]|nr:flippase [Candidatus Omnitrophota bacterium]